MHAFSTSRVLGHAPGTGSRNTRVFIDKVVTLLVLGGRSVQLSSIRNPAASQDDQLFHTHSHRETRQQSVAEQPSRRVDIQPEARVLDASSVTTSGQPTAAIHGN